jgi:hypothetical protein
MNKKNDTRQDKIQKLKDLLNGRQKAVIMFASRATDGELYADKDLVSIYYSMTFKGKDAFESWKLKNGIDSIAYSPDVLKNTIEVTLNVEYEPLPNAKPCNGQVITFGESEVNFPKAYVEREAIVNRLCNDYKLHPPKGFEIKRVIKPESFLGL